MSVHRIFTLLCLAGLCLGSARIASAASVTGSATFPWGPQSVPFTITVSPGILRVAVPGDQYLGRVADVAVVGNVAVVLAQITQSTDPNPPGSYFLVVVRDN